MSYFVNYIPERSCLVVIVRKGQTCDLAPLLKQYEVGEIAITGTPVNVAAVSDYPQIEVISVNQYEQPNLNDFRSLTKLKSLTAAFGHVANIELDFCSDTLEYLHLFKLSRVKDLSRLTRTCMPRLKTLVIDSIRNYVPPDFQMFPNLVDLRIKNTNWTSLEWLPEITTLEYLSIWGSRIADNDWRPLAKLQHLKTLHGMQTVFRSAGRKEFARIRPDVELY